MSGLSDDYLALLRTTEVEKELAAERSAQADTVQRSSGNADNADPGFPPPPEGDAEAIGVRRSAYRNADEPTLNPLAADAEGGAAFDPDADVGEHRPFALPIREFIALEREHREPMLADSDGRTVVGHRSLTLLGALGGHGKTTWAIDLLLHMAAGVNYPPWSVPQPLAILVIENEGPEELFAEKLKARLAHFPHELKRPLGRGPTLLFAFDPDTEAYAYIGEESEEERDYLGEIRNLLADGTARLVKEICVAVHAGERKVQPELDGHSDVFEQLTAEQAIELGRRADAKLWRLRVSGEDAAAPPQLRIIDTKEEA